MKNLKKVAFTSAIALSLFAGIAEARDQIKIVGSSTVYPFTSYVAEEFGAVSGFATPVVESTGTGGGMKLFCSGNGLDTPDITNASRPMKAKEFELCQKNGVNDITGMMVGFDGIAFAQNKINGNLDISTDDIFLALADEIPNKEGKLIKNPYNKWSEINPALPNRDIIIYGPPSTSGTRDSFDEMVMMHSAKKLGGYPKDYKNIRQDGKFVPAGENDNLIVQKLDKNKDAFGIFGYSFLEENSDIIVGAKLNGIEPTPQTIGSSTYPVSRSLYIYVKNSHRDRVKGLNQFVDLYVQDKMIGSNGILKTIGLVPMLSEDLKKVQTAVIAKTKLTKKMVDNHTILPQ